MHAERLHVMPEGHIRRTFTLPRELLADLGYVASRLRVSQSALVSLLLTQPIHDLREVMALVSSDATSGAAPDEVIRRMRGASTELIQKRLAEVMEALGSDPES